MKTSHQKFHDKRTGCLHHNNAPSHIFFFTRNSFYQKQRDCRPQPSLLFSVFPIEDKTEGLHFNTFDLIEAQSQKVLNTLTKYDFWDAFEMAEALGTVHTRGRGQLQG
jgi:hypothetical protein